MNRRLCRSGVEPPQLCSALQLLGGERNGSHAEIINRRTRDRESDCLGLRKSIAKADDA